MDLWKEAGSKKVDQDGEQPFFGYRSVNTRRHARLAFKKMTRAVLKQRLIREDAKEEV